MLYPLDLLSLSAVLSLCISLPKTFALPASAISYHVLESLPHAPEGWSEDHATLHPEGGVPWRLRLHLMQQNRAQFEEKLMNISTPGNPEYGMYMSQATIRAFLQPAAETVRKTTEWLLDSGIPTERVSLDGDVLYIDTSLQDAEDLLQTKYRNYKDESSGVVKKRALQYSIPAGLKEHIETIQPTTMFGKVQAMKSTLHGSQPAMKKGYVGTSSSVEANAKAISAAVDPSCNSSITPGCLRELYSFANYTPPMVGNKTSLLGIGGFLEQWAQYDDTAAFLAKYDPADATANFTYALINGGTANQTDNPDDAGEANLDIEYAVSISAGLPVTYYSTGGRPPIVGNTTENDNEPYFEFLSYLLGLPDATLPTTVSISYGEGERTVPFHYAKKVCNLFAQVGARGVSILVSSGDGGPGGTCVLPRTNTTRFGPVFPAACPFVTAVGATVGVEPENAVTFSGGGFSDYFARPAYQNKTVQAYLDAGNSANFSAFFNGSGRAFPDVSAQGTRFHVILAGSDVLESGTSASAPTFASVINLVNNELIAAGKKPLGFLNPWLYKSAGNALTDVVTGTSTGCGSRVPGAGFAAVKGWDPVTGLGTPLFRELVKKAMKIGGYE